MERQVHVSTKPTGQVYAPAVSMVTTQRNAMTNAQSQPNQDSATKTSITGRARDLVRSTPTCRLTQGCAW